jgi:DNA repair protein RadA/Sms
MRVSSIYICQNCGYESAKWQGQCPSCGKWNSLVETAAAFRNLRSNRGVRRERTERGREEAKLLRIDQVNSLRFSRLATGINELDRVLGGGIVPGSMVLIAGEPGMGKSTLLTQLALKVSISNFKFQISKKIQNSKSQIPKKKDLNINSNSSKFLNSKYLSQNTVFYVCGEESPSQVKLRIERIMNYELGIKNKNHNSGFRLHNSNLFLLPETNVENITASLEKQKQNLIIIDSIQTLWTETLSGMPGSVGQISESTNLLTEYAKKNNVPVFLVGHVTKEGVIAGPKVLEHMVDTVLYLEGDKNHEFRILRAVKNRFGPTDEVGVFSMKEVSNPSGVFIGNKRQKTKDRSGSCTVVTMQGLRPMLVEIQALCVKSQLPVPRRIGRGIDSKRLQILCAVLQKKAGINIFYDDVYVSVAGGLKLDEPAVDFGICLAIASSNKNKTIYEKTVAIGEVGLLGEIRRVNFLEKRIKQAKALGYNRIFGPEQYSSIGEAVGKILK